jgi:hypothetical protein
MKGGRPRRRRLALLVLPALFVALVWPASSQAFVACSFSGGQVTVTLTSGDDTVAFSRFGSQLAVLAGYDPQILLPCNGGTPTVENTDSVLVQQTGSEGAEVDFDLSQGPFAPGATPEADGSSEIEFNLQLAGRRSVVFISGTGGPDNLRLGTTPGGVGGVNLNAGAEPGSTGDSDVQMSGARYAFIGTGGGADVVNGQGGPGFTGPIALPQFLVYSGAGRDLLTASPAGSGLQGGPGRDILIGSSGGDFIDGGGGRDTELGGKGRDAIGGVDGKKDRIRCGPGADRALVDNLDKPKGCERLERRRARHRRGPAGIGQPTGVASAAKAAREARFLLNP